MWSRNKKEESKPLALPEQAIIEIEATKDAQKEAFEEAHKVGKQLNKLLVENGFTLKIYLATGGKHEGKTK